MANTPDYSWPPMEARKVIGNRRSGWMARPKQRPCALFVRPESEGPAFWRLPHVPACACTRYQRGLERGGRRYKA